MNTPSVMHLMVASIATVFAVSLGVVHRSRVRNQPTPRPAAAGPELVRAFAFMSGGAAVGLWGFYVALSIYPELVDGPLRDIALVAQLLNLGVLIVIAVRASRSGNERQPVPWGLSLTMGVILSVFLTTLSNRP